MQRRSRVCLLLAAALLLWVPAAFGALALKVSIEGIGGALLDNVRAYLSLQQSPPKTEAHLRRQYRLAPQEIRRALQALGYYEPTIETDLQQRGEAWEAKFRIQPGPPVILERLEVRITGPGAQDPVLSALAKRLPLRRGEVFNHGRYEDAKQQLQSAAADRGYFDARLSRREVRVDPARRSASGELELDTGPRYRFGPVSFEQQGFKPELLQRFVPFKQGDAYLSSQLLALQSALVNSDYFSDVQVRLARDQVEGTEVPVTVTLERRKQHRYSVGLGYGTDTGPRGTLGWENRRINPRGHRARAGLELSSLRTQITAAYEVPLSRPLTDWLVFQAALTDENTDTANSTSQTLSAQRVKSRGNDWLETLSFNFLHEDFEVGGETGTTTLVYPAANWTRVRADDRVYPRRGHRISVDLKGTDPALGSDTRLIQVRADGKLVQALGKRGRALLRGSLGGTWVGDFNALPASMRFFAGGDQSVRGYGYNTLGPRNALDQVRGGHFLVVGSAEYDYRFADKWSGAVFYDVGNAIDHFTDDLKQGLGFGVRWRSPVGPIRVDLAAGLNDPDSPVRLHFTMGPDL